MNALAEVSGWRAELVAPLEGDVLEIGVGTGANLAHYRRAASLHAIEPHPARAAEARAAVQALAMEHSGSLPFPITIDVAPAEALPYTDARFDVVVSSLVFCSVADPTLALREIRRVLRPSGLLHMIEHVRPTNSLLGAATDAVTPVWRRFAHNCHLNRSTLDTLRAEGWQVSVLKSRLVFRRIVAAP